MCRFKWIRSGILFQLNKVLFAFLAILIVFSLGYDLQPKATPLLSWPGTPTKSACNAVVDYYYIFNIIMLYGVKLCVNWQNSKSSCLCYTLVGLLFLLFRYHQYCLTMKMRINIYFFDRENKYMLRIVFGWK